MPINYTPAPDVRRVAQDVIRDHHTHLITNSVYVLYLFTDEAEKIKGKRALGTARKVSGLNAFLARMDEDHCEDPTFFLICVWEQWWRSRSTTDDQRRALVDHELCHLHSEEEEGPLGNKTGRILLSLVPHDLEEFNCIVDRHGAWEPSIDAAAGETQLTLPELQEQVAAERNTSVTLTTRQGSVTLSSEKLREQAERAGRGNAN